MGGSSVASAGANSTTALRGEDEVDVLRWPVAGAFLKWKHSRTLLQVPLFVVSVVMILHGLFGTQIAPKNLATVLTWVHFRGALVFVLLAAGNFFCLACPFMLVRQAARKIFRPRYDWPRFLRNKWLSGGLFVFFFLAVLLVDGVFKHASFCKFVCPIGQFNFVASTFSPLEVKVRNQDVCTSCMTKTAF